MTLRLQTVALVASGTKSRGGPRKTFPLEGLALSMPAISNSWVFRAASNGTLQQSKRAKTILATPPCFQLPPMRFPSSKTSTTQLTVVQRWSCDDLARNVLGCIVYRVVKRAGKACRP